MGTLAILVAVVLTLLSLLHLYWAFGGHWPGSDAASLAHTVVGGRLGAPMPSAGACAAVALALALGVAVVLARGGFIALPLAPGLVRFASVAIAAVFTLRGAGGFFEARLRPAIVGSPYAQLNVALYSPLALVLGLATWVLAL